MTPKQVALALARASKTAGQAYGVDKQQSVEVRAENLVRKGPYGAYVTATEEHPGGWAPKSVVVIGMEEHGGKDGCNKPLDYYGDGMDVAFEASAIMGTHYIEFINAAVAAVYEV